MVYRVTNIKVEIGKNQNNLTGEIAKKIGVPEKFINKYTVVRKALDARKKERLFFVYTLDVVLSDKGVKMIARRKTPDITARMPVKEECLQMGEIPLNHRPVVVGAGPAGLFAALELARSGFRPVIYERGQDVETRAREIQEFWANRLLNPESNVQFGEGGAGTFSDGKLTTRINDGRVTAVLEELVRAGAPEEILYLSKPHIGTDRLRTVVRNLRLAFQELGGEIYFGSKVTDLLLENGLVRGLVVNGVQEVLTETVVLATGHSARDTYEMLETRGCSIEPKAFSIGVRIEHSQSIIDKVQYGSFAGHAQLGAADYQLVHKSSETDRTAYSFCMCPGGQVVAAASEENTVVTNGMSNYARKSGIANSALVVSVGPDDFGSENPLAGMEFQRRWERAAFNTGGRNYSAPAQLVGDFLEGRASSNLDKALGASYRPGLEPADLHECLPGYVTSLLEEAIGAFDRKINGFSIPEALLTGVETRTSAPVRLVRDNNREAEGVQGLYPTGEGAGYAGGIVSAAVDGIRVAEAIIGRYRKGDY